MLYKLPQIIINQTECNNPKILDTQEYFSTSPRRYKVFKRQLETRYKCDIAELHTYHVILPEAKCFAHNYYANELATRDILNQVKKLFNQILNYYVQGVPTAVDISVCYLHYDNQGRPFVVEDALTISDMKQFDKELQNK